MKKVMCAKCGGQKMAKGGKVGSKSAKSFIAGIPNSGPTGPNYQGVDTMKKGGSVKKAKLAALAAPKNKITRADVIAGAKMKMRKKK